MSDIGATGSFIGAFLGGLLSFLSPCVLPIVPGYLSFISGVNLAQVRDGQATAALTRRVALTSLFFVLGFSTVFVALGAAASLVVGALLLEHKRAFAVVGGAVILVLGLHTMGVLRIPWLLSQHRADAKLKPVGLAGAYVVGLAFAFGWTPCIGPILAGILALAAERETVAQGVLLLSVYSAGLGIPFLIAAFAVRGFFAAFARLKRYLRAFEIASGVLLVAIGLLLLTDRLAVLSNWFAKLLPFLQRLG
jgi:cytochrome c-type biogenesis protein